MTGEEVAEGVKVADGASLPEDSEAQGPVWIGRDVEIGSGVRLMGPVVIGDMHGVVDKDRLVTSGGARPGDLVVMTKSAGIEGTSILAAEKAAELRSHLDEPLQQEALRLRRTPGISVVTEALLAASHGVTAMHDPTEGGIAMGLYELATASEVGIALDLDAIPILAVTQAICRYFGLNPLWRKWKYPVNIGPGRWPGLRDTLQVQGIPAQVIGTACQERGISAFSSGKPAPFTYSETDELAKVL